jgi:phytoene desaturase
MKNKKIIIIGAGPGGLSSAMILSHRGYDVTIYEKEDKIGGRTSPIKLGDFTFDLGPTFIMLPKVFEDVFELAGKNLHNYVNWKRLDVLYKLHFDDGREFPVYFDKDKFKKEIARLFPGDEVNYDKYMKRENIKYDRTYKCLEVPYGKFYNYLRWKLLRALPYMDLDKTIYEVLSKYFTHEDMKISMAFQAKYLGMSPWNCPGTFSMLSYVEHRFGIYHPIGGVHKITEAMSKVVGENGGKIFLNKPIKEIIVENNKAVGVMFMDGTGDRADHIIMNADFAQGMKKLLKEKDRKSWNDKKIDKSAYSCSTFMMYLALDKKYEELEHHNVFFAKDYKKNVEQIFDDKVLPEDPSFYIQNASKTDNTLAPEGKSTIYVLVPVPNLTANIDWDKEKEVYRELVLNQIIKKTNMKDIRDHIVFEKIITPNDFEKKINVYKGAVFNLAHNITQMLYLRPHNKFEDIDNMYLVGGGTHPGSGLPTILESGRIVADMIDR